MKLTSMVKTSGRAERLSSVASRCSSSTSTRVKGKPASLSSGNTPGGAMTWSRPLKDVAGRLDARDFKLVFLAADLKRDALAHLRQLVFLRKQQHRPAHVGDLQGPPGHDARVAVEVLAGGVAQR